MRELPVRKWSSIQSLRTLFRSLGRPIYKTITVQACLVADCKTLPLHTPLFSIKSRQLKHASFLQLLSRLCLQHLCLLVHTCHPVRRYHERTFACCLLSYIPQTQRVTVSFEVSSIGEKLYRTLTGAHKGLLIGLRIGYPQSATGQRTAPDIYLVHDGSRMTYMTATAAHRLNGNLLLTLGGEYESKWQMHLVGEVVKRSVS